MITLSTDFGGGYYISQMRGVLHSINPEVLIEDFYHHILPQNILEGSFILSQAWRYYPRGTIHLGIVDPGVGSARKGMIFETENCFFVGPDNGLFGLALAEQQIVRQIAIDEEKITELMYTVVGRKASKTFHGRDIFAPTAALLSSGISPEQLGKKTDEFVDLKIEENQVLHIDSFGNVILNNISDYKLGETLHLFTGKKHFSASSVETFSDASPGELIVLKGSHGFVEVDVNKGSAAEKLGVEVGDVLRFK
ncbi:MAG: SAM-dependent chlorinase/fluorinase [Candidatus Altiarchaeota archaeon]